VDTLSGCCGPSLATNLYRVLNWFSPEEVAQSAQINSKHEVTGSLAGVYLGVCSQTKNVVTVTEVLRDALDPEKPVMTSLHR